MTPERPELRPGDDRRYVAVRRYGRRHRVRDVRDWRSTRESRSKAGREEGDGDRQSDREPATASSNHRRMLVRRGRVGSTRLGQRPHARRLSAALRGYDAR